MCGPPTVKLVEDASGGPEWAAINRIDSRLRAATGPAPAGEIWIGDDAAVVGVGGGVIVVAADALVAGVHADLSLTSRADLGWKALAVNVSDIAAMGCEPRRAVVTVAAPSVSDIDELYEGLAAAAAAMVCPVVGGDLTSGPVLTVSVTVMGDGAVTPGPVLRSGARAGDEIWVSGPLGGASAGLRILRAGLDAPDLVAAHARPVPRVGEGTAARLLGASAMIDVSDGFAADVGHLLDRCGVGAELDELPVAEGALPADAVSGGDDYELIWCAPPSAEILSGFAARGLRAPVRIGRCVADPTVRTLGGHTLTPQGWEHWA
ncbi:MAG: thiamine-phosphate kinase [Acidimicrobiales bacterium]